MESVAIFQSNDTNFSSIGPEVAEIYHLKFRGQATFVKKVKISQGHNSMTPCPISMKFGIWALLVTCIMYTNFHQNRRWSGVVGERPVTWATSQKDMSDQQKDVKTFLVPSNNSRRVPEDPGNRVTSTRVLREFGINMFILMQSFHEWQKGTFRSSNGLAASQQHKIQEFRLAHFAEEILIFA